MSQVGPGTPSSSPVPSLTELWVKAWEAIRNNERWPKCERIPRREQPAALRTANMTSESLTKQLKEIEQQASCDGFQQVLFNIGDILKKQKDVGGNVAALNPYASIAWGSVQVILTAGLDVHKTKEDIKKDLIMLTSLISEHQTLEAIYTAGPADSKARSYVERTLFERYQFLLKYQMEAVIFWSSSREKWLKAISLGSRTFLEDARATVEKCEGYVKKELGISHKEVSYATYTLLNEQHADKIKSWISPSAFAEVHESKRPIRGTCDWIQRDSAFEAWYDVSQSCALWLRGGMGMGKTHIRHDTIESLKTRLASDQRAKLAYYYCISTENATAQTVLTVLLKQLA